MQFVQFFSLRNLIYFIFFLIFSLLIQKPAIASHACGYNPGDCGCDLKFNQWSCVASTTTCFADGRLVLPEWLCETNPTVHNTSKDLCDPPYCNQECVKGCPGSGDWQKYCAITQGSQHCYGGGNNCNADVRLIGCQSMFGTNTCTETVITDTRECWIGGVNPNPTNIPDAGPTPVPVPPAPVYPTVINVIGVVFEDENNNGKFDANEKILGPRGGVTKYLYQSSTGRELKIDCDSYANNKVQEANAPGLRVAPKSTEDNKTRCFGGYISGNSNGTSVAGNDPGFIEALGDCYKWSGECFRDIDCNCHEEYAGISCVNDGTCAGRGTDFDDQYKPISNSFHEKLKDFGIGSAYIGGSQKSQVIPVWGAYSFNLTDNPNSQLKITLPDGYEITRAKLISTNGGDNPLDSTNDKSIITDHKLASSVGGFDAGVTGSTAVVVWGIRTKRVTIQAKAHLATKDANCNQIKDGAAGSLNGTIFAFDPAGDNGTPSLSKTQTGGDYVTFTDLKPGADDLNATPPSSVYESVGYCVYKNGELQNPNTSPQTSAKVYSRAGDIFDVEAGFVPTKVTIKAKAHVTTANANCATIKDDPDGLDNTTFHFNPSGTNGTQPEKIQNGDNYVEYLGLTHGTDTLVYNPPGSNYDLVRLPCLYINDTFVGAQAAVTTQKGDNVVFELGYNLNTDAWVQTQGGDIYADEINSFIPNNPAGPRVFNLNLNSYNGIISYKSSFDFDKNTSQDGVALAGQGNDWLVQESMPTVNYYDVFYQRYGSPEPADADYPNPISPITKPASRSTPYFVTGNATLGGADWVIDNLDNIVLIVDGDLTIDTKINFAAGAKAFVAFIVSGDIKVSSSVGTTRASTTPVLEGIFVSGETFFTGISPTTGTNLRFVGKGSFIAKDFSLQRDLDIQGNNYNKDNAAELFIYNPDLIARMPDIIKDYPVMWQEVEP